MRINVFEGARRIALILAALATIVVLLVTGTSDPYLSVDYHVSRPNSPPVKTDEPCPTNAGRHYFSTKTPNGHSVGIDLCLLTMPFGKDSEQLVPYKIDQAGMIWGAASYSNDIDAYEREIEKYFELPSPDAQWADHEISKRYRDNWLQSLGYLAIGLAAFWVLVWCIGWIVRGFAGIPRGKDSRQSDA
ncbi:MAG: hypothetical protein ACREO7_05835 [Pseudoxanthomonas sp.]